MKQNSACADLSERDDGHFICHRGVLLVDVVPAMIQVFTDSGQVLPVSTRILLGMSQMAQQYGLYVLVGLAVFSGVFIGY